MQETGPFEQEARIQREHREDAAARKQLRVRQWWELMLLECKQREEVRRLMDSIHGAFQ
jgi:hypothetical protein